MSLDFRPCVVGVFANENGKLLVGERSDVAGAWQFPQGGIEPGESAISAIFREMKEEIGCGDFRIIKTATRLVSYRYPGNVRVVQEAKIAQRYAGQTQQWFLLQFFANHGPNLKKSDGEFARVDWRDPIKVLTGVIDWKRQAYIDGLHQLGIATSV
jgi:putative (di)nucleoside polyphosphate hydrolase